MLVLPNVDILELCTSVLLVLKPSGPSSPHAHSRLTTLPSSVNGVVYTPPQILSLVTGWLCCPRFECKIQSLSLHIHAHTSTPILYVQLANLKLIGQQYLEKLEHNIFFRYFHICSVAYILTFCGLSIPSGSFGSLLSTNSNSFPYSVYLSLQKG
jgi:hypothetical protein